MEERADLSVEKLVALVVDAETRDWNTIIVEANLSINEVVALVGFVERAIPNDGGAIRGIGCDKTVVKRTIRAKNKLWSALKKELEI